MPLYPINTGYYAEYYIYRLLKKYYGTLSYESKYFMQNQCVIPNIET